MAHYQVIIAFDGTGFNGFQRQAKKASSRTVQGEIELVLRELGWTDRAILAAGRTDRGVHASGQVISFDLDWKHTPDDLRAALNARLPEDVAALSVKEVAPRFHPRYDAVGRRYRYRIYSLDGRDPLKERFAWRVWPKPDLHKMQDAAACLVGTHDFAAFGSPPHSGDSTIRCVYQARWQSDGAVLDFEILANAFLYHMVRRLVFTQVMVGLGKLDVGTVQACISGNTHSVIHGLAPAQGLVLVQVIYQTDEEAGLLQQGHGTIGGGFSL